MKNTIGNFASTELRKLRAEKNVSLEEATNQIGIDINTLGRYEKNKCSIKLDILSRILDYYDIGFDIFFKEYCANKQNVNMVNYPTEEKEE